MTTWVIDDTGFLKQGTCSVGVQRQYTGSVGKIANCQVGVSLSVATRTEHLSIDLALYLPTSWTEDPARRAAAKIPENLRFQTKIELALGMIESAIRDGLPGQIVPADSAYGESNLFRETDPPPSRWTVEVCRERSNLRRQVELAWVEASWLDDLASRARGCLGRLLSRSTQVEAPTRRGSAPRSAGIAGSTSPPTWRCATVGARVCASRARGRHRVRPEHPAGCGCGRLATPIDDSPTRSNTSACVRSVPSLGLQVIVRKSHGSTFEIDAGDHS